MRINLNMGTSKNYYILKPDDTEQTTHNIDDVISTGKYLLHQLFEFRYNYNLFVKKNI